MTVTKRKTSKNKISWYYRFMRKGKLYTGVCKNCTTQKQAEEYDKQAQNTWNENSGEDMKTDVLVKIVQSRKKNQKIQLADAFRIIPKSNHKKRTISAMHSKRQERYWLDFVAFLEGQFPPIKYIGKVSPEHAKTYWKYLCNKGKFKKDISFKSGRKIKKYTNKISGLSNGTCNSYLVILKSIFQRFIDEKFIFENPFESIKRLDKNQVDREAFTDEELVKIKEYANDFIYPIFIIGLSTGFREGDICTLRWSDVDLKSRIVTRETKKTGAKVIIPLMPQLFQFLVSQYKKTGKSEHVLPDHAEMYQKNPTGITWRFKKFLESIGIKTTKKVENRTRAISIKDVHSLRHTFCSLAGINNIPLVVVQSIVGHMTPAMTEHYQKHVNLKNKRVALQSMPPFLVDGEFPEIDYEREKLIQFAKTWSKKKIVKIVKFAESIK
jgi:integrase